MLKKMPKLDLHCHLDGSMGLEITQKLLNDLGETYEITQLKELLEAPKDCNSLAEYLKRFDLPIRCIQTKEGLEKSAEQLALSAFEENVKYLEVRFAPSFSTAQGLSICEIVESVQKGLQKAHEKTGIYSGIIVCGMRNLDMDTNIHMLKEAVNLYDKNIMGSVVASWRNRQHF